MRALTRGLVVVALVAVAASAAGLAGDLPFKDEEVAVDAKPPLVPSLEGLAAIVVLDRAFEAETRARCAREDDERVFQDAHDEYLRHVRATVAEARKWKGTTAALTAKYFLAQRLTRRPPGLVLARRIVREIQADCPGTWQAVMARMLEAGLVSIGAEHEGPATRKDRRAAVALSEAILHDLGAREPPMTPDERAWALGGPEEPLRARALASLAHHQYWAALPVPAEEAWKDDVEMLEKALATYKRVIDEHPRSDRARSAQDQLPTIESFIERSRAGRDGPDPETD